MTIANTLFKHHPRRLSTWTSPSGLYKNQIDYTLIRMRWRTSITNTCARPGAICGSDHKLLKSCFNIKLKTVVTTKPTRKFSIPGKTALQGRLQITGPPPIGRDANERWEAIKTWIVDGVNGTTKSVTTKKKHWMTERTIDLIDSRRQQILSKAISPENRKILDKEIQKACREDKNNHIKRACEELEEHANNNRPRELHNKVKYLSREFKPQTQIIKKGNGEAFTDTNSIAEIWRQYCEKLFDDTDRAEYHNLDYDTIEKEPPILRAEIEKAVRLLKNNKAPGEDGITTEIIKATGELGIDTI